VALAADEEPVGAFGANGTYEPFGVAFRSGSARRRFHDCDVFTAKYVIERSRELGVPVADEETERADSVRQVHGQIELTLCVPETRPTTVTSGFAANHRPA
jgi:hypothetical protein